MVEDVLRKIIYRGYYDPLPNLDPGKKIKFGVSALNICKNCLGLYGKLVRVIHASPDKRVSGWRYQKCECMLEEDYRNGIKNKLWPGCDFNVVVEICYCCGRRLINSGTDYSYFFCDECVLHVHKHNKNPDNFMIPYGRLPEINGIIAYLPISVEEFREFKRKSISFYRRVEILKEWRRLSLFENLHDLGIKFQKDIWLGYYEKLLGEKKINTAKKFERMVEYLFERYME